MAEQRVDGKGRVVEYNDETGLYEPVEEVKESAPETKKPVRNEESDPQVDDFDGRY